jgi:L-lactate dehydrogenase complex protein LldG
MDAEAFLARLRGRSIFRAVEVPPVPRGRRPATLEEFRDQLIDVGGVYHAVPRAKALDAAAEIASGITPPTFVIARTPLLEELRLGERLERAGLRKIAYGPGSDLRRELDPASLGVVEADLAIVETGTIVLVSRPEAPRLLSCLPPHLLVVLDPARLVGRLEDLPGWLAARGQPPSAVALVSGPSATGDVDQRLVIGAHGPADVQVLALT